MLFHQLHFSDKETDLHIHSITPEMCYAPTGRTAQILTMSCFSQYKSKYSFLKFL